MSRLNCVFVLCVWLPNKTDNLLLLQQQLTCTLAIAVFTATLGSLQYGYSLGVINAPQKVGFTP